MRSDTRRAGAPSAREGARRRRRVAMTLEQSWHRVPGGTARAALDLASALAARDDVDLVGVTAAHRGGPPEGWELPVAARRLPLPRPALYEAWHGLRRPRVQLVTGPVDVVHATSAVVPPKGRAALVVTVHDLAPLLLPEVTTRRGRRVLGRGLALARRDADLVLCSSRATLADCERAGFPGERLRLVPLGVRVEPASATDVERVRARHDLARPYVLWVGTREPRKNLPVVLDAHARLRRAGAPHDLVLVGPAGWGDVGDAVGGGDGVRTLGFVPGDDLRALYAGADVFCWPSRLEGFGLPVLEAMAQGTPVVTSTGTATEELVEGGAGLAVDPADPASVAAALTRVLEDPALAEALAGAGRRRAGELSWEACAERCAAAYAEVAP